MWVGSGGDLFWFERCIRRPVEEGIMKRMNGAQKVFDEMLE